jgi:hypothetical protein
LMSRKLLRQLYDGMAETESDRLLVRSRDEHG